MNLRDFTAEDFGYGLDVTGLDMAALNDALRTVMTEFMSDPARMTAWMTDIASADQAIGMRMFGQLAQHITAPIATPLAGDKRFSDPAWTANPFLASMLEAYLVRAQSALKLIDSSALPEATRRKARFALTMLTDALAPSNIPWLNPTVIKEAYDTGGASLMRGMQNYLHDLQTNDGKPQQVDISSFELGRNLAATPGRVVFRNELIELLAYEPQTTQVYARPLLCSPPWINKYYIMDLAPGRSFIEWAVRHGHQTFAISYRNPDETMANLQMDDYLRLGPLAALDAIERITGTKQTNIAALCLGGTLTTILLAYLTAHGESDRIGCATLTNTMVDFREPGDLGVFTDESTIVRLEHKMHERGFLDSSEMAGTFDWMRANDLIWGYVINNWFMGRQPPAFDILRWNADSTRMPASMHSQYLRSCYLNNSLVNAGAFSILDTPLALRAITTPLYILGAEGDHIAPWRSSYMTVNAVGSDDIAYTLTNAGHVAGIVNPPENRKAVHWTKPHASAAESADQWRASATKHEGSWWLNWAQWIGSRAGERVAPYSLPPGEPAPGRYVKNETGPPVDVPARTTALSATTSNPATSAKKSRKRKR